MGKLTGLLLRNVKLFTLLYSSRVEMVNVDILGGVISP